LSRLDDITQSKVFDWETSKDLVRGPLLLGELI